MERQQEDDCVRRAKARDREAFAALTDVYWPRVFRWVYGMCHSVTQTEDLTQDVFLKAWAQLDRFETGTSFRAWLFRIARNLLIDQRRGPRGKPAQALPDSLVGEGSSPLTALLTKEGLSKLREACARLPDDFRAVFLLRTQHELPFADIAHILSVTEETIRWRLFKARQFLLRELQGYLYGENE